MSTVTWLVFLAIVFFLPYALSVSEMGSAFPEEGGPATVFGLIP